MSTAADFRFYYPSKYLTADGQALTVRTVTGTVSGFEKSQFVDTALVQADDYWNGGIIEWLSGNNIGLYGHIKSWVLSTNTMTLYKDMAYDIAATDTYRLILGGNYRSSLEVPGLTVDNQPALITNVTITYAGYENSTGNASMFLDADGAGLGTLQWKAPGSSAYGVEVAISGTGTYYLFDDDDSKWVQISVSGSLPLTDQEETIALSQPEAIFIPDYEGVETLAGKTRYHLLVVRNINATDKLFDVRSYLQKSVSTAADTTTTSAIGQTIETLSCTSLANWPTSGWIYNSTRDDIRYYYNRSGNNIRVQERVGVLRGKTPVDWQIGDSVQLWPEFDIGLDAPSSDQFENPATETTAPSGVTFFTPTTIDDALTLGTLDISEIYGVWIKELVVAGTRARPNVLSIIKFKLDVSGT